MIYERLLLCSSPPPIPIVLVYFHDPFLGFSIFYQPLRFKYISFLPSFLKIDMGDIGES